MFCSQICYIMQAMHSINKEMIEHEPVKQTQLTAFMVFLFQDTQHLIGRKKSEGKLLAVGHLPLQTFNDTICTHYDQM